jgi:hypothetical protein
VNLLLFIVVSGVMRKDSIEISPEVPELFEPFLHSVSFHQNGSYKPINNENWVCKWEREEGHDG